MKFFDWLRAPKTVQVAKPSPVALALEPRMMFDGAITATVLDTLQPDATEPTSTMLEDGAATPHGDARPRQELLVIDKQIVNYQDILKELKPGTEVLLLEAEQDGLQQMVDYLQGRSGLDAIHILSHGSAGTVHLGNLRLSNDNLDRYTAQLALLGTSLADHGDILLYGCDVAANQEGVKLLSGLAAVTQADLSASINATGSVARGGDWILEQQHGVIETQSVSLTTDTLFAANNAPYFGSVAPGGLILPVGSGNDVARSSVVQPDGKILLAGYSRGASNDDFSVVRLNADGSLDASFANSGKLILPVGSDSDVAYSMSLQADGKILLAGSSVVGGNTDFSVVRLNADGSLDASFANAGKLILPLGSSTDQAYSMILQADGKILLAGYSSNGGNDDFCVVRLNADGSLDASFADSGKLILPVGNGGDVAYSMSLQTDGKILLAGYSRGTSDNDFSVVRLNTDGSLDASFANSGKLILPVGSSSDYAYSISLQPDGKILLAGYSSFGSLNYFSVVRLNADGSLDTSFADSGKLILPVGSSHAYAYSISVQPDGKILLAGFSVVGSNTDFSVVRLNADGSLDTSFAKSAVPNTLTYTENAAPVTLNSQAAVFDAELAAQGHYAGASLSLSRNGGAEATDVFGASGNLRFSGSDLVWQGTSIGTVRQTAGTLTLTFNNAATQAIVNAALQTITYQNTSEAPPASVTINWLFNDGNTGSQGSGGALTALATSIVNIIAVNDAPVISAPANLTVTEDVASALTGISFSDADAGASPVTVTLSVASGTLSAISGSGVTVGGSSNALTLSGSIANINAFIAAQNLTYTTALNVMSNVTLNVTINDGGNTGSGGALSATQTITLAVAAVNDAPVISAPANLTVTEDVASALTGISFSDVDAGVSPVTVTLSVASGALNAVSGSGVTVGGTATALTLSGSIANINAFIAAKKLTYTTALNATDNVALTVVINDGGNTGSGGSLSANHTITLKVAAVNDAPVISAPANLTVTEDVSSVLSGISFSDVDAGTSTVTVTLSVASGALNAISGSGVTVGGTATALTLSGSIANINAFIAAQNLTYTTALNATANVTLNVTINDGGNTGSGGVLTARKSITLAVAAVNDAPQLGSPDAGKLILPVGTGDDTGRSSIVQPDGKILLAGYSSGVSNTDFSVVRLNADGSLDASFADSGKLILPVGISNDTAHSMSLQPDGKILLAGYSAVGSNNDFSVVRLNADGSLDASFANSGKLILPVGSSTDQAYSMSLQPDGKILLAGYSWGASNYDFSVVRLNADGSLDASFADSGKLILPVGSSHDYAYSISLQPDGKILLAGYSTVGRYTDFSVVRLNADGSLDASFANSGKLILPVGNGADIASSISVLPDGKILLAGMSNNDFSVVRLNADGSLDANFADSGKLILPVGIRDEIAYSMSLQADGKILLAGYSRGTSNHDFSVVRLNADGSLDTSFANPAGQNTLTYTENAAPVTLKSQALVFDAELAAQGHYAGASLSLSRNGGAEATDVFGASGDLSFSGSDLVWQGTSIGTVTQTAGTLTLTFNNAATQAIVNAALQAITYQNTSDAPPASVTINWLFNDGNTGSQGSGGALTGLATSTVNIIAINDAPVISAPANLTVTEDVATALTGISFSDVDAGTSPVTVTLSVASGALNAVSGSGVTVGGTATALTLSGRIANINAFIAAQNLSFTTDQNATANVTLNVTINDGGNTGSGGALSATQTITLEVAAVNDAPVISAPANLTVTEDVASALTGISFSDVDAGASPVTVTLSVASGVLSATTGSGVTVGGIATALTLSGNIADINAFIAAQNLSFTTDQNATANVTLNVTINDGGNTGSGGSLSAMQTITLEVAAVNDAPVISAPANLTVTEDVASALTGISFSDVDAGASPVTVTLLVASGVLNAASGAGVTVGGTATALTLSGSIANINAFIAAQNLSYTTALNATDNVTLTVVINDGGNAGSGGALEATHTITLEVAAVNDAPVISAPANLTVTEDVASALTGISFSDVDAGASPVTVTLSVASGALNAVSGLGVTVGGTATALTLSGSIAEINAFIAAQNLSFTTDQNATANVTLNVTINDGGNTGSGGSLSAAQTITLEVAAVNDAPVISAPANLTVTEDVASALTGISFSDVDAGASPVTVTLSVASGVLSATTGSGVTVGGTASALTLSGSIAEINAFIAAQNLTYTTALNATTNVALTVVINDGGNTGSGGSLSANHTITLEVAAVNDAPVISAPANLTVTEDVPSVLTGISFSDVDAGTSLVTATLSVASGALNAVSGSGVTVGGTATALTLSGSIAEINAFIAAQNLTYTTALNATTNVALTVVINDGGNTGSGGALEATQTITLEVAAVNDAPVISAPANLTVTEDVSSVLTGISFSDVDAGASPVTVTLSVASGALSATSGSGVTVGGSSNALTMSGSIAEINAFIAAQNLTYTTALNATTNVPLTVVINDGGNTGSGGSLSATHTITLEVAAVNDAPVISAPANLTVTEDVPSVLTGISFSDVDAGTSPVTVTLSVASGALSATSGSGVTVGGSATALTLSGSIADINAFIAAQNLSFTTDQNATANVTLNVTINDGGNTGSGGSLSATQTITLEVAAVNDAPLISAPANLTVTEDVASVLTGISFSDVDAGASPVTVTLSVASGALNAVSGLGVTVGGSATALTLSGSIANINAFIAAQNLTYTTALNATNNVALTVVINDGGNTGSGGALDATQTITLEVAAVNDAPVISAPANLTVTEDVASVLTGISFSDVDAGTSPVTVTLSVASGALNAASGSGVTVGGTATALTLSGSIANINAFIAASNLTYTTALNATANVALTVVINDGGNTGSGGALGATQTITLAVAAVNDAPEISAPANLTVTEDVASALTGISFSDVDAGASPVTVTLSVASGALNAVSGLGVTVGGTATALTLSGSIAEINAFIAAQNLSFTTDQNATANVTLNVTINDGGNTGSGGALDATQTITLEVAAVNDAPVISAPANLTVTEDVASALTSISFSDVDAGTSPVTVTLSVASGTLSAISGSGITVGGSSNELTLSGSIAEINAFIAAQNLTYTTALNATANVSLDVTINDGGNTGSGASLDATQTITLEVAAVNDAPTISAPANLTVTEDVPSVLTGISFSDVDAGTSPVTVTLLVASGALNAVSGLGVTVAGSATTLTLSGSIANINAFIAAQNLTYTTALNATANVALTVVINDGGNTGSGGALSANQTITLEVAAVNDAPVISAPATVVVTEDVATALTGISFSDVDAGASPVTVTLSVASGVLNAASGSGVTVGGTATALTLSGSIANINAFIAAQNLTYTTALNATANVSLDVTINDANTGSQGTGDALSATQTITLDVAAVNDAPVISAPANLTVTEDVASALTGISFSDVDAGTSPVTVTLLVASGALNAVSSLGVTVVGSATALTLSGSIANINAFIAAQNLTYTTALNATANVALTVVINDGGNSGSGGALSATQTITLAVAAVNDAPVISAPANLTVTEDVATALTGISFSDVDAGASPVTVTLSVASGALNAVSGLGVTVGGSATALTLSGSIAEINAFIAAQNLTYTTALNATDNVTLTVVINDGGNTGSGGALEATHTITLEVAAVNDAPTISAPSMIDVKESIPSALTGIQFNDIDAGNEAVTVSLTVDSGTLSAVSGNGVTVAGTPSALTLTGVVEDINAFIEAQNVRFTTATYVLADVSLTIAINDGGNTGSGGALAASAGLTLKVNVLPRIADPEFLLNIGKRPSAPMDSAAQDFARSAEGSAELPQLSGLMNPSVLGSGIGSLGQIFVRQDNFAQSLVSQVFSRGGDAQLRLQGSGLSNFAAIVGAEMLPSNRALWQSSQPWSGLSGAPTLEQQLQQLNDSHTGCVALLGLQGLSEGCN